MKHNLNLESIGKIPDLEYSFNGALHKRLCNKIIHTDLHRLILIFLPYIPSASYNQHSLSDLIFPEEFAYQLRSLITILLWHLNIHKNNIIDP